MLKSLRAKRIPAGVVTKMLAARVTIEEYEKVRKLSFDMRIAMSTYVYIALMEKLKREEES